ncbi:hypothetical protein [Oceanobacillus profundus]|uniref:hypothetical protein n=1 Tax=Oceanobacillus profundus TaxID=372463 RepID=UPI001CA37E98|nr:hypothetical protein [Oceanobacillus profundus]
MTVFIVLYEHYLRDHQIEIKGVFADEGKAFNCREESLKQKKFRDECWIAERNVI